MPDTILVVDDEENLVELLKFRLEANGYKVESARDGIEGLSKMKSLLPRLVILDVMMPKMNGYDVVKLAKKDSKTSAIPIIILTARAQTKDLDEGIRAGADICIAKPFEPVRLLSEIKKLIK